MCTVLLLVVGLFMSFVSGCLDDLFDADIIDKFCVLGIQVEFFEVVFGDEVTVRVLIVDL